MEAKVDFCCLIHSRIATPINRYDFGDRKLVDDHHHCSSDICERPVSIYKQPRHADFNYLYRTKHKDRWYTSNRMRRTQWLVGSILSHLLVNNSKTTTYNSEVFD